LAASPGERFFPFADLARPASTLTGGATSSDNGIDLSHQAKVEHFGTCTRLSTDFRQIADASAEHFGTFRNISAPGPAHFVALGRSPVRRPHVLAHGVSPAVNGKHT
jgi:hypothetical protein